MTVEAWTAGGAFHTVGGHQVFVRDEPARDADAGLPAMLVLHGFPTNSYDFASVLDALRRSGASSCPTSSASGSPTSPITATASAARPTRSRAWPPPSELTEVDLLSHDMGDSVAGELLAGDNDGQLGFAVGRRVLTNGSIYLDLAQLTTGQQLLLSLPDEAVQISDEARYTESLAATSAPVHRPSDDSSPPSGSSSPTTAATRSSLARSATSRTAGPRSVATRAPSRSTLPRWASCGASSTRSRSTP